MTLDALRRNAIAYTNSHPISTRSSAASQPVRQAAQGIVDSFKRGEAPQEMDSKTFIEFIESLFNLSK